MSGKEEVKSKVVEVSGQYTTVPTGKVRCYITDKLREDTPEEHVRQRMARSLVEEYGYSKNRIGLEQKVKMGVSKKRADIVVYHDEEEESLENVYIIVEAKKESVKPTHKDEGLDQLKSYLSATPNSEYGMWVGSEVKTIDKKQKKGKIKFEECLDIPFAEGIEDEKFSFSSLVPATDVLKDVFKRCHNYIAANQGKSKENAFHEFLKVTFCKVYDERMSSELNFYIDEAERRSRKGRKKVKKRVNNLFSKVCSQYGYIFGKDEEINLKSEVISYIVSELQKYSLIETDFDYKGQAYEEIVGANSRGDRGEFFTPRNLCELSVNMVMEVIDQEDLSETKILDPACGTGGFLKTYVHGLNQLFYESEMEKWDDDQKAKINAESRLKAVCDENLYGIDFNPVLVRAAQMNLVMHGDGSSNVFHENTLLSSAEWDYETRQVIQDREFDAIITNPPFGEGLSIDDPHVLDQYELSTYGTVGQRTEMAPQELFIERCYRLLKPGGVMAVVTPDSIVSNPSYSYIREWIVMRFNIIASISLPVEMFEPSTGTQTSLLLLSKRKDAYDSFDKLKESSNDSPVFMSTPKKIGHDKRGHIIPLRDKEGKKVIKKIEKKRFIRTTDEGWKTENYTTHEVQPHDDLPQVQKDFEQFYKQHQDLI